MSQTETELDNLYNQRFPEAELQQKHAIWKVLCIEYFNRYVKPTDTATTSVPATASSSTISRRARRSSSTSTRTCSPVRRAGYPRHQ
ncbi:hypothetical protein PEC18_30130 [Paucibacter sp. O1-1]|nr:hypothetical protein [Paucibacter sp. O1-1]MDA3829979.1 hypothetical protein [Paucibacter sp. O1-1]